MVLLLLVDCYLYAPVLCARVYHVRFVPSMICREGTWRSDSRRKTVVVGDLEILISQRAPAVLSLPPFCNDSAWLAT